MHIEIWKLYLLRTISIVLMLGGPFFMRYFDEEDKNERMIKMLLIFMIPMGFLLLGLSFWISGMTGNL